MLVLIPTTGRNTVAVSGELSLKRPTWHAARKFVKKVVYKSRSIGIVAHNDR
jgi:hypothetical protein